MRRLSHGVRPNCPESLTNSLTPAASGARFVPRNEVGVPGKGLARYPSHGVSATLAESAGRRFRSHSVAWFRAGVVTESLTSRRWRRSISDRTRMPRPSRRSEMAAISSRIRVRLSGGAGRRWGWRSVGKGMGELSTVANLLACIVRTSSRMGTGSHLPARTNVLIMGTGDQAEARRWMMSSGGMYGTIWREPENC